MMCAVNSDFCIMPDKAGIVDRMVLLQICYVFIYTSFPLVLKCCSPVACSVLPLDGQPASCFLQSCEGFAFDKG